jgi:2-succinyl-6-hydroxy-2,4-cyclohexadiene-1-carboxylate synthase
MAPTVLLLHGFTHTGASWDAVIEALGERYRALAPDLRGHGSSSSLAPVTLDMVLRDLDRLAPRSVTLAGYSMGGRLALHFALARPKRVQRLVLIGASPGLADADERRQRRRADELLADELEHSSIEQFGRRWEATPVLAGRPPAVRAAARIDRLRNEPVGLARALRGLGTGALPSLWERLGELRMPVRLVVGERDARFLAIAERMAPAIARAELIVVPGSGHAVHLEAPELVAAQIAS